MAKAQAPSEEIQLKALEQVQKTFSDYSTLLSSYRTKWYELFRATYVFETDRNAPGQSTLFFPKAFEQVEKVTPRIIGNKPKFVLGMNVPINPDNPDADMQANAMANQASLNYYWKIGNCQAKGRTWAKGGIIYGVKFALVTFNQKKKKTKRTEVVEKNGELVERIIEKEEILMEYPTFEVPDILDVYFDPRIERVDDMPAIILNKDQVRLADILNSEDCFNLDKLKETGYQAFATDNDNYKLNKFSLEGIPQSQSLDKEGVGNIKDYYGVFCETGEIEDEKLVRITVWNNSVVIRYKELNFLPFEKFCAIEIPNQGVGMGLVEPIKKLQDAYNLTRNQRFENVSLITNRMWLIRSGAGVDTRKLVSRAGNIIPVKNIDDIQALQTPDVTASSFDEAQSLNTEIQTTLGTIDTTQDNGANGFTNLATGQKIRWNEYNVRFKAIKENFEEALGRLGEKMLRMVGERATQNPLIEDEVTRQFYEVAKTAFNSVSDFYTVSVLADSTAYDSIENKRDDVLAFAQLAVAYKAQGIPINMNQIWEEIVESFPGKDPKKYLQPPEQVMPPQQSHGVIGQRTMDQGRVQPSPEDALNQSLTQV